MCHTLMQQGTLDVRFPRACRKIQADTLRGCHTSPGCLSRRRADSRMSGEPARRHDGSLPPEYAASRPEKTHDVRARPFGRPKGISARPGDILGGNGKRVPSLGGSKSSLLSIARFHLPGSGTVFLYAAFKPADVIHQVKRCSHIRISSHEAEGIVIMSLSIVPWAFRSSAANMPLGYCRNRRPPESFRQWPHDVQDHILTVFLNSRDCFPAQTPPWSVLRAVSHGPGQTSHHQSGRCLSRFCCPDGGSPRNSRPTAGPQIPAGSVSFQDRPGTVHRLSHSHQDRSVHAARPVPSVRLPAPSVPQTVSPASRECFALYLPVKKIFKLPMPGLFFQQS